MSTIRSAISLAIGLAIGSSIFTPVSGEVVPPTPTLPAPLEGIDTIMFVGASLEAGMAGNAGAFHPVLLNYGRNKLGLTGLTSIVTYGYPGADVDAIYTSWTNTIRPALIARADGGKGVLILAQTAGNTVTSLQPYAMANPTTLAARKAKFELLNTEMKAQCGASNVVVFDHTFRLYGSPSTETITNEDLGSKPFNEIWVDPEALKTPWNYQGKSYGNPYNLSYNWYSLLLIDAIHFNSLGYQMLGNFWMSVAAACIKGTLPPLIAKKANPIGDQKPKSGKALIVYRNTAGTVRSSNFPLANARGTGGTTPQPFLAPWDGFDPVLGLSARPDLSGGMVTQSGLGTGDTSYTIMNDAFRDAFTFSTSQSFVLLEEFINLIPGQQFQYEVLCARSVAAGQTRWQEFSEDGVTVKGSINAACFPGNIPRVFTGIGVADANGKGRIYLRCMTGNAVGAYANAILITPLPLA